MNPHTGNNLEQETQSRLLYLALVASDIRKSDSQQLLGDPLDVAVAIKYKDLKGDLEAVQEQTVHHFSFDVEKRRSGGILSKGGKQLFAVKGAFEAIRPKITSIGFPDLEVGENSTTVPADEEILNQAEETMRNMASRGLRVIAVACRKPSDKENPVSEADYDDITQDTLEEDLVLAGFLGIEDPVREEVPQAVEKCHSAGIDVLLVTGDHPDTAIAVARKSSIIKGECTDPAISYRS